MMEDGCRKGRGIAEKEHGTFIIFSRNIFLRKYFANKHKYFLKIIDILQVYIS